MKAIILLTVLAASSISMAAATCDAESVTVAACASAPKAGDSEFAIGALDNVAICTKGADTVLVLEKDGQSATVTAKVESRAGGVSYTHEENEASISISYATGVAPAPTYEAQFTIVLKAAGNMSSSSTFFCKK